VTITPAQQTEIESVVRVFFFTGYVWQNLDRMNEIMVLIQTTGNENATHVLCFDAHLDITPPTVTNATTNQSDIPDDTDYMPLWGESASLNVTISIWQNGYH